MLRSNNPIKVIAVYKFRIGQWGVWTPCIICHLNVSPSDQNCSKTITFILQPRILNRYLPNKFRSDHLIKRAGSVHISHRARFGVLSPEALFLISMLSPWAQIVLLNLTFKLALRFKIIPSNWNNWSEIFEYTPTFFVKMHHFWCHWRFYGKPIH